ncbi:MAG: hypothetical protein HZA88_24165 [Verrucomicrobia bacterium]|nr:hypothetical protein [Verrucomicrobiota bacterium]
MNARNLWSKILTVAGGIGMAVGAVDPLEGSLLILPGSGLLALGVWLSQAERRAIACKVWAFILIVAGMGAMCGLGMAGGCGGSSGRSIWWGLLVLPYLIGWSMAMWGPGSPRWLAVLGIGVGVWFLNLTFIAKGGVSIVCGTVGALTIAGSIYRLWAGRRVKTMTVVA